MKRDEPSEIAMKVVDNVDVLLAYWDREQRCKFANASYQRWFGKSRPELLGITLKELLGPVYELNLPYILAALRGETPVFERAFQVPDGSTRYSLASYHPDIVDGVVNGFTVQVTDVTQLKRMEFELQEAKQRAEAQASHDFLTGLPNRMLLNDRIAVALAAARRNGGMFAVVAIDLDDFKSINDTHGHAAGDEALKEVACRMTGAIREMDTVARLGGDEFIVLVNDVKSPESVESTMRRMLDAVSEPWSYQTLAMTPSMSCGVAIFPADGASAEELLSNADAALYKAKKAGKNRLAFAG